VKYIDPKILWDNVKFINKEVSIEKREKLNQVNSKASSIRKRRPLLVEKQ
jgi:hypothetical protein